MKLLKLQPHCTEKEIYEYFKSQTNLHLYKFWQVIYAVYKNPGKTAQELSAVLGITATQIYYIVQRYNKLGKNYTLDSNWGGRREANSYLSLDEEKQFFKELTNKALLGEILSFKDIKVDIEQKIGREVSPDYVWNLFKRHQWHKTRPRPTHPQSNKEEQEDYKKNSKKIWLPKN